MSQNAFDRLISFFSPRLGLQRARHRAAEAFLLSRPTRGYDGATMGRRAAGWGAGGNSADAEIFKDLPKLRDRSRDLVRNNPYAARAINTWVDNIIGSGIIAHVSTQQDVVEQWMRECDYDGRYDLYGLEALIERTAFESGECLVRFHYMPPEAGMAIPLKLQVLEPDYLDSGKNTVFKGEDGGGYVEQGVEFDAKGRRVAYWLYPMHPGSARFFGQTFQSHRVPADEVIHYYEALRPGQTRGVPRLAPVVLKMRDTDDYEEAELLRKGIESCFVGVVTTEDEALVAGSSAEKNADGRVEESISAGMFKYLRPGESITFGSPAVTQGYREYIGQQLRAIAAGIGITAEMLTGDLSEVNYSSMRGGRIEFQRGAERYQWQVFVPQVCHRIEMAFKRAAMLSGKTRLAKAKFEWAPPKWSWVDPLKDASGVILELAAGLTSWEEEARKRGWTPEKLLKQMADNQKAFADAGVKIQWEQLILGALAVANQDQKEKANA